MSSNFFFHVVFFYLSITTASVFKFTPHWRIDIVITVSLYFLILRDDRGFIRSLFNSTDKLYTELHQLRNARSALSAGAQQMINRAACVVLSVLILILSLKFPLPCSSCPGVVPKQKSSHPEVQRSQESAVAVWQSSPRCAVSTSRRYQ